ncbi:hypothetical protein FOA52_009531 [Chlamydomonas sp. UWO 241]|nr:hypothetical protein FOA52_009531 [Chlamydomonas sp. UWO 241]
MLGGGTCKGCGMPFLPGTSYTQAMGGHWHQSCLLCQGCRQPLTSAGPSGTQQQSVVGADGKPYHAACHKAKFHPKCDVCGDFLPQLANGSVQYKEVPFWKQRYCSHHETGPSTIGRVPQCNSCSRLRPFGSPEWVPIGDDRELCLECVSSVVVDTKDAQPLYEDVLAFYRSMGLDHPQRAPMMLVDSPTLTQYSSQEGKRPDSGPMFHVRGLCLATVYRSIPTVVRTTLLAGLSVSRVATPMHDRATTKCSVSAILVMYGLPRLLTGGILAHELMHAWLRMRHVSNLKPQVEEGLCQLMAMLWLDHQHARLGGDAMQERLLSHFAYQIREDVSTVYGDGFRTAYDAFQRAGGGMRGLSAVLNRVLKSGELM